MSKIKKNSEQHSHIYYAYNIDTTPYTEVTREADPEEDYDGDDTHTDWTISSIIEPSNNEYRCDIALPFQIEDGKTYYAVYVIYHEGDSFSNQMNANLEIIDVFTTKEKAQKVVDKILEGDNQDSWTPKFIYENEIGIERQISAPWTGYFNGIGKCDYQEVALPTLKNKIKRHL